MSRVHDALRKAAHESQDGRGPAGSGLPEAPHAAVRDVAAPRTGVTADLLSRVDIVPYIPLPEALLVNLKKPREAPGEEFRTLRTRLNHLQTIQPLQTLVVTSASPDEGKSFTATNRRSPRRS